MTNDDKIRDERLQYDINKEAAKISAWSNGKIDKYKYLTGEEILPSNQKQILEQAKFVYSPSRKAFKKQTKTIEDQGEKQIRPIEEHGKQLIKSSSEKISLELLKQKNFFDDLLNKRMFEMNKLSEGTDFNNLTSYYTSKNAPKDFVYFKCPLIIYNDIKDGE